MHTLHAVMTKGTSAAEAESRVQEWLNDQEDTWWDWYEIGGRWDGHFNSENYPSLNGQAASNTVPADSIAAQEYLNQAHQRQEDAWRRLSEAVLGLESPVYGIYAQGALRTLAGNSMPESESQETFCLGMWAYSVEQALRLAEGRWNPESGLVDSREDNYHPSSVPSCQEDLEDTWLVAVDFHY